MTLTASRAFAIPRAKTGNIVAIITTHKSPQLWVLAHRFAKLEHAERMAAQVHEKQECDRKHWVRCDITEYCVTQSLKAL